MGFALWLDQDQAWCAGTHEYRPMGVAVVAATDLFVARDFRARRRAPNREAANFRGLFASLDDVNRFLRKRRPEAEQTQRQAERSRQENLI